MQILNHVSKDKIVPKDCKKKKNTAPGTDVTTEIRVSQECQQEMPESV